MGEEFSLSESQLKTIKEHIQLFQKYTEETGLEQSEEHRMEHRSDFMKLTQENLLELGEEDLNHLLSQLWALEMWGTKEFPLKRIHNENDFAELKRNLANLLFGDAPVQERYDNFRNNTKHIGMAIASEMLCLVNPEKYGIWNAKAREGLRALDFEDDLPLKYPQINGTQYRRFLSVLKELESQLEKHGFGNSDLLLVDYFLYFVTTADFSRMADEALEMDHDEVVNLVRDIGEWLGFISKTNQKIAKGSEVDVIWNWRIGNIGDVKYAFEVQKKGSKKSAVVNLLKASIDPAVQRIVVVSDKEQLDDMNERVEGLSIEKSMAYWDEGDVLRVHENLQEAYEVLSRLRLMRAQETS